MSGKGEGGGEGLITMCVTLGVGWEWCSLFPEVEGEP